MKKSLSKSTGFRLRKPPFFGKTRLSEKFKLKAALRKEALEIRKKEYYKKVVVDATLLVLDGTPPSLNGWLKLHWAKQSQLKKAWERSTYAAGVGKGRIESPVSVMITFYFKDLRDHDIDNIVKFILDGLKYTVMEDDSYKKMPILILRGGHDAKNPRTEILVQHIPSKDKSIRVIL